MNLSCKSTYDNVSEEAEYYSKSLVCNAIKDLLNINDEDVKLFCPLCVNSFECKFTLFEHLETFHSNFLMKAGNQKLRFNECPFCNAKFYGKHLTAKHSLLCHAKLLKEFLVDSSWNCLFCGSKLRKDYENIVKHIQETHFLTFEEEFKQTFCCGRTFVIKVPHSGSNSENFKTGPNRITFKNILLDSNALNLEKSINVKNYAEASRVNCYDFTDLKEQLEKIKNPSTPQVTHSSLKKKRSILKNTKNVTPRKSVRRVLRFDLTDNCEENKENSVLMYNLKSVKQINIDEHSLLCNGNTEKTSKFHNYTCEYWNEKPKHSSTPNSEKIPLKKIAITENNTKKHFKSTAKSYSNQSNTEEFQFQCGKCRKLFKENSELVSHITKNHKKLGVKGLQPCYRCAICSAKFFRNHYLKKHHKLHKVK